MSSSSSLSSDDDLLMLVMCNEHKLKRKRSKRKYWVHHLYRSRLQEGEFHTLFKKLEEDEYQADKEHAIEQLYPQCEICTEFEDFIPEHKQMKHRLTCLKYFNEIFLSIARLKSDIVHIHNVIRNVFFIYNTRFENPQQRISALRDYSYIIRRHLHLFNLYYNMERQMIFKTLLRAEPLFQPVVHVAEQVQQVQEEDEEEGEVQIQEEVNQLNITNPTNDWTCNDENEILMRPTAGRSTAPPLREPQAGPSNTQNQRGGRKRRRQLDLLVEAKERWYGKKAKEENY
ncbi:hypothetical protein ABEB36_014540 [Hypothenemus hampei]|uniref:Uncharacterized protein n=1 Tax=Hypothenemus hampei TaxID=57062 RepID=A0ABD1E6R6_HYPHA